MKRYIAYYLISVSIALGACEYDNFEEPKSMLHGRVTYEGQAIGVRTNGPQLELWQDGYELNYSIPVFIAQDGTYSVSLFDGEYKLVRRAGGPWLAESSDTLIVNVKGNTEYEVPVTPYYLISEENYEVNDNTVSVSFHLDQIVDDASLQEVNLYLGYAVLTDQNRNEHIERADVAGINLGGQNTIVATIPESLQDQGYVFARVGVRSNQSGEFSYTQVQKIEF